MGRHVLRGLSDSLYVSSSALRPGTADALRSQCCAEEPQSGLNIPTRILPAANHKFFGRPEEMDAIHLCLEDQRKLVSSQPRICIIHGMGGVGKTALARQYVEAHSAEFDITCWIASVTRHDIVQCYHDLGRQLRIPGHETHGGRTEDRDAERIVDWLSNCGM